MKCKSTLFYSLLFSAICVFGHSIVAKAQCMIVPIDLEERLSNSETVIEGTVIDQHSFWDAERSAIRTASVIEVHKVYKGVMEYPVATLITFGGQVGNEFHQANPSLKPKMGDRGIWLMNSNTIPLPQEVKKLETGFYNPSFSVQSFLHYDMIEQDVHDITKPFTSIKNQLYPYLKEQIGNPIIVKTTDLDGKSDHIRPLATPVITSISSTNVSAGTGTFITINGSNFGFAKGSGYVGFKNANFGDGRFYRTLAVTSYKSWSDSKIEVLVPSSAGSGEVRVVNNNGEAGESTIKMDIKFAQINTIYKPTGGDSAYYQSHHIDDNGRGGYTWQFNHKFRKRTEAVNAFLRAVENWRCETLMNWEMGDDVSTDKIDRDNINVVRFTDFTNGTLGVCYTYFSGCSKGSEFKWYVAELDIEFDSVGVNWHYGATAPQASQMHFESVAVHELGHGHQLTHVIDQSKIMHYSIGNGDRKSTLHTNDIEGGVNVRTISTTNTLCGPGKIKPISIGECKITTPKADYTVTKNPACENEFIQFSDNSEGTTKLYYWDFGDGASPQFAYQKGPIFVKYTTPGTKTVTYIAGNDSGSDTTKKEMVVLPLKPTTPEMFWPNNDACMGTTKYGITAVEGASSYLWTLSGGGSILGDKDKDSVTIEWTALGGPNTVTVQALGQCGNSDIRSIDFTVIDNATSSFTSVTDGVEVTFTNTSTNAPNAKWYFGNGDSSTDLSPVYTYPNQGDYTVTLVASNGCSSQESEEELSLEWALTIHQLFNENVQLYPNPASKVLNIKLKGQVEGTYSIVDSKGSLIERGEIYKSKQLDVEEYLSGLYHITVELDGRQLHSMFTVE